jgi:hypothetical protein
MDGNTHLRALPFTAVENRPAIAPASQREDVVFARCVSYTEARR